MRKDRDRGVEAIKKLLTVTAAVAVAVICAAPVVNLTRPMPLAVPTLGIEVLCEWVRVPTSQNLQEVIDKPDTAARFDRYILDHAGENFHGLWNIREGDEVVLGERRYICSFITTGRSRCGVQGKDGTLPKADLYLCTCKPDGEEYEIYIVGVNKEK